MRGRQRDDAHHLQAALLEVREARRAAEVADRIRQPAQTIYQALIELELTAVIGAAPNERTDARSAHRNGHRDRLPTTTAGDLELRMPKLRMARSSRRCSSAAAGSTRPCSPWSGRPTPEGVSTRKVDDLVKALGADTGISKSEVSRLCASWM